jgi:hypothetical protein
LGIDAYFWQGRFFVKRFFCYLAISGPYQAVIDRNLPFWKLYCMTLGQCPNHFG